jgi:hypothetical protein
MIAIEPRTVRNTVAWYCAGLGAGRSAGLQGRQTERPHGTRSPHRMQRSYRRFTRRSLRHPGSLPRLIVEAA